MEKIAGVPKAEFDDRVARARALMQKAGVDSLVVTDPTTYFYFTGQRVPAWMKMRPSIFVLPLDGEPALISWSGPQMFARCYDRPYPSWVEDRRIYPEIPFTTDRVVDWGLRGVLEDRGLTGAKVAIELGQETTMGIPLVDFFALREQLPKVQWMDSGEIVWGCRMIKSEWEIECSRKACEIGGKAWKRALEELKPGVTIREIQVRIMDYYFEDGADLDSGPPTCLGATGADGAFQKGDVLYLDGGPAYMGYQMDFTRRAVFGPPSDRQRDEHEGMWDILFRVMDRMKPGVTLKEVFEYSQSLMVERPEWRNYSDHPAKRIGHGIGFGNEPPSINAFDTRVLQPGMILTPEPKIESPDGLVNPEEHIVMTEEGWDRLSMTPDWPLWVVE